MIDDSSRSPPSKETRGVSTAQIVLPGEPFDATLAFFRDRLRFRLDEIFPADRPRVAVVSRPGLAVRLDAAFEGAPGVLRIVVDSRAGGGSNVVEAPNGTRIEWVERESSMFVPPLSPELVVTRHGASRDGREWNVGRAGMRYRDLLPSRLGGRFIASHIHIPGSGPVPDHPHYHDVRFQMIFCHRGSVRVAYEEQGETFTMHAGDCVLQPPRIRHRVVESRDDLEVIEIACPAEHVTYLDHAMTLPNADANPETEWSGQRFLRHVAANATWEPYRVPGFSFRDTGMSAATRGLAACRIVRAASGVASFRSVAMGELTFHFVRTGHLTLRCAGRDESLGAGDAFAIPAGVRYEFAAISNDLEWIEVMLPAIAS